MGQRLPIRYLIALDHEGVVVEELVAERRVAVVLGFGGRVDGS